MNRFTQLQEPAAEARIQADLDRIVAAVRATAGPRDSLAAVFLLGGYARGDGTAVQSSPGSWRGFNDYDLLLMFDSAPEDPGPYQQLARDLARELEIDFVDLGLASRQDLETGQATLFWYEFYRSHRVLWRRPGTTWSFPDLSLDSLDPLESVRLLHNRGMSLLWSALRLWPQGVPRSATENASPEDRRFGVIAGHKAVLAAGEARLLPEWWSLSQAERAGKVLNAPPPWAGADFPERYRRAVAFRRAPDDAEEEDATALWAAAREAMDGAMREEHRSWLERPFETWAQQRRLVRRLIYADRIRSPRRLKRWLTGRAPTDTSEPGWFAELPRLLFRDSGHEPWTSPDWRRDARRLIQAWHP